jgi:hypothetical protein
LGNEGPELGNEGPELGNEWPEAGCAGGSIIDGKEDFEFKSGRRIFTGVEHSTGLIDTDVLSLQRLRGGKSNTIDPSAEISGGMSE